MVSDLRRILFVHDGPMYYDNLKDKYYGIHYDDNLVNKYSLLGSQVTFLMRLKLISGSEIRKFSPINSPNFTFIQIPDFKSITSFLSQRSKARKIILNAIQNHDLIIVRLPSAAGAIAYHAARRINKPVLLEVVACVFDALWNYDWRGKLLAHYKLLRYKYLIRSSEFTLYVTHHFLQSRYPTRGKSIGCSDVVLPSLNKLTILNRFETIRRHKKPLTIGTIAALDVPYKGQADVIKALGILKKDGFIFNYKLVGQGNPDFLKAQAIKHSVEDLVYFIGPLPHEQVFHFLEEIDIYIQPSKQEGLPRSLIEALSTACPSIGSKIAGIPELLCEDCLFQAGNVNEIVRKLKDVNVEWMMKYAEINFNTAMDYQKEVLEKRQIKFYNQFLNYHNFN